MNRSRNVRVMIAAAILVFACAPVFSPSVAPTLDPGAMSTLIAQTAGAANAGTAAALGLQPIANTPQPGAPLLGADLNTAVAETAAAAATQTAALIPPTWTPSFTPFPSHTPSITPTPTPTFIFLLPTRTRTPRPTSTASSGGGGGGGGGGGSGKSFDCTVISVSPALDTLLAPHADFQTSWTVRNTGDTWQASSTDLVYVSGNKFGAVAGLDMTSTVKSGKTVTLPGVSMSAPGASGTYSAIWNLRIGKTYFCSLTVRIEVK